MLPVMRNRNVQGLEKMNAFFNDFWKYASERSFRDLMANQEWLPALDVSENDKRVLIRCELPGVDAKDISLDISGDRFTIRGEKKMETDEAGEDEHYHERFYGGFRRTIQLPADINSEAAEALFENGVLKVDLPKAENQQRKKIEITSVQPEQN